MLQNSLYAASSSLYDESVSKSSAMRLPRAETTSHNLPLGVRSFLDGGNGPSSVALPCFSAQSMTIATGSSKAVRQEYAAQLKQQMQTRQALQSLGGN
jgi:hypothetical protein